LADNLTSAIARVLPADNVTRNGLAAFLDIFTKQANVAKDKIEEQQVQQSKAASHRMQMETRTDETAEQRVQSNTTEKNIRTKGGGSCDNNSTYTNVRVQQQRPSKQHTSDHTRQR
jgi:hypothetical protein